MKRTISVLILVAMLFCATPALAAPAPVGPADFVIRVGNTDVNLLTEGMAAAQAASGKALVHKADNTRNRYNYRVSAREATFYTCEEHIPFATGVSLTKYGKTARGIQIGSTEAQLLAAYPAPKGADVFDADNNMRYYYFQAPNAPSELPAAAFNNLAATRPDYFYKLAFTVSKKTGKVTSVAFHEWYEIAVRLETTPLPVAPISKADFALKIGKGAVNLIDQGIAEISKLSGKKAVVSREREGDDYWTYYTLKASEATFYTASTEYMYVDTAVLTKKGATARGIRIGSTEKALLAAYPTPLLKESDGGKRYYAFGIAAEGLTEADGNNLDRIRPLYYYYLCFTISQKTRKVTEAGIMQVWAG